MLTKTFLKTKGFLIIIALVAIALTVIVAIVLRSIFGAINMASQIDQEELNKTQVRINKANLEKAAEFVTNTNFEALDLR